MLFSDIDNRLPIDITFFVISTSAARLTPPPPLPHPSPSKLYSSVSCGRFKILHSFRLCSINGHKFVRHAYDQIEKYSAIVITCMYSTCIMYKILTDIPRRSLSIANESWEPFYISNTVGMHMF